MKKVLKILLAVFTTFSLIITLSSCGPKDMEIYMFSDLSECRTINSEKLENVQVTVYDSPKKDKCIKDLMYNDFYACDYSSAELQFQLFAYEFPDQKTTKAYFENATGVDTSKSVTFLDSQGITTYERVVISNNFAYTVFAPSSDADEVGEFLNQVFSERVIVVDW